MFKKVGVLFSSGLDSILTALIMKRENFEVYLYHFINGFEPKNKEDGKEVKLWAKRLNLPLRIYDITEEMIKIVISPKYGYGDTLNPCIDCKILMLSKMKEFMDNGEINFVATGEVIGQRPMTQNKSTMRFIEKQAKLDGYIVRPLSYKLLKETILEKEGIIKREKFYDINGRSRKIQMKLIEEFGINNYPQPAGGCLLTDIQFSERMKKLIEIKQDNIEKLDILLLKRGKFKVIDDKTILIIPRNNEEKNWIKQHIPKERISKNGYAIITT